MIIIYYHTDNIRLTYIAFINSVNTQGKTISYCRVKSHFQNGIFENRIRYLQKKAINQTLHVKSRRIPAIELSHPISKAD